MKKILFIAPYLKPVSNAAALRCQSFLDVLRQDYILETLSYGGSSDKRLLFKNKDSSSGFMRRLLSETISAVEVLSRVILSKSDLLLFSYPPFIPTLISATYCAVIGRKYILDVRDTYPEPYFRKNLLSEKGFVGRLLKSWVGWLYQKAQHVTTVTESIVSIIHSYGTPMENITLIRNGYDSKFFQPFGQKYENFTVVFHGHLSHFRELHLIPELAKLVPEVDFLVIGDGAQGQVFRSENIANLKYVGHQDHEELAKMVCKAHVGLSFRSEDILGQTAFPVKVYEYIGAGLVTIVTPVSEVGRFLEQMNMGYQFQNSEIQKIKETILNLKNNLQLYQKLTANVVRLREQFDRKKIAQEMNRVISVVLNES